MGKLMCPHCKSTHFFGTISYGGAMEVSRGEDGNVEFNVLKQNDKGQKYEISFCAKCKKPLSVDQLTEGYTCKECGAVVDEVDENGICLLCQAKKTRQDLVAMSKDDLLRMFLSLEKKELARTDPKVVKGLAKAEEIANAKAEEATEESVAEAPVETPVEAQEEAPKTEKKRRARKKVEAVSEPSVESTADTPAEESGSVDEFLNEQPAVDDENAPFPDLDLPSESDNSQENTGNVAEDTTPVTDPGEAEVGFVGHSGGAFATYDNADEDSF